MEIKFSELDVVCLANYTSINVFNSVCEFVGEPVGGNFFLPLYYEVGNVKGAILLINSHTSDLLAINGIKTARRQFMKALEYIQRYNPKVVVLGASLKRLFGAHMEDRVDLEGSHVGDRKTIKEHFSNILFTNGDNGTSVILLQEVDDIINKAGLYSGCGKIGVLGAGLLGVEIIQHLFVSGFQDYQINIISSYSKDLKNIIQNHNVNIYETLDDVDCDIDVLLVCTHNKPVTAEQIKAIGIGYVCDVAAPAGFSEMEFIKSKKMGLKLERRDAGNAYNDKIIYHFDPKMIDLADSVMYSCFAEGTSTSKYIKENGYIYEENNLLDLNFFDVTYGVKKIVSKLFLDIGYSKQLIPICFGKRIY